MRTRYKILFVLATLMAITAWYGYRQYTRKNKDLAEANADVVIDGPDLVRSFEANEKLADRKYLDKVIAVTGNISEINKDENGYYTLVLGKGDGMSAVRCSMDSAHQQTISTLKVGDKVMVQGACTGFNADALLGSDVILNRCVLKDKSK